MQRTRNLTASANQKGWTENSAAIEKKEETHLIQGKKQGRRAAGLPRDPRKDKQKKNKRKKSNAYAEPSRIRAASSGFRLFKPCSKIVKQRG